MKELANMLEFSISNIINSTQVGIVRRNMFLQRMLRRKQNNV